MKRKAIRWYSGRKGRGLRNIDQALDAPNRDAAEAGLPTQAYEEAELEKYNVQDDIQQMVVQFGYLALFSPVWPLIPVGFLINNWIELRSDFLKICIEHQRPSPTRADSIGPWLDSLSFLNWLGSISTAAIVYLFRGASPGHKASLYELAATIFVSEHIYLVVTYLVSAALKGFISEAVRKETREQYARRKKVLDELEINSSHGDHVRDNVDYENDSKEILNSGYEIWFDKLDRSQSIKAGIHLIKSIKVE